MRASRLLSLLLAGAAFGAPLAAQTPGSDAEARAAALVAKMTLAEKLQLVHGYWYPTHSPATPDLPAGFVPSAGAIAGIPRLGIPTLYESDASLGVANQIEERKGDTATALPSALATAATFDPAIAQAGGAMIGAEARAKRFNVLLAGGVNLTRDPWGGRDFEYMGEDPLLAGTMAGASIAGVQSNHIVSTVKHYVLNAQETGRFVLDARLGEQALRESDLLAFKIAIDHGKPASVMCAYNQVNGDYACESHHNLTDILKGDWHYPGWVMSDWGAVHSTEKAALAGLDQESGQQLDAQPYFGPALTEAVKAGRVPQARIDDMVTHILTGVISSGLMDDPLPTTIQPINYAAHADIAQRNEEAAIVLLKNENGLLPLAKTVKRIVLIGAHADVGVLSGGGSSQVRSVGGAPVEIPFTKGEVASFARMTWHASSPLQALQAAAPNATITYVDGRDPVAAAKASAGADLAIVFAWQWQSEAQDAETLALPDSQDALIANVYAANPRTAVVLETGGPVLMPWLSKVPAVIEAWYPGQRGGEAIAAVLTGGVNPSGRLPITFPATEAQAPRPAAIGLDLLHKRDAAGNPNTPLPMFDVHYPEGANVGYRWYQKTGAVPLFPFGYGLGYTNFRYSALRVTGAAASFTVTNSGRRTGIDVPQIYVEAADGAGVKTYRLAGWARIALAPGQSQQVTVALDPRTAATWDVAAKRWTVPTTPLKLAVGHDATDHALSGTVSLKASEGM